MTELKVELPVHMQEPTKLGQERLLLPENGCQQRKADYLEHLLSRKK